MKKSLAVPMFVALLAVCRAQIRFPSCSFGSAQAGTVDRCSLRSAADPARRRGGHSLSRPARPYLNKDRVREAEQYNMSQAVPGRINSIVNIHNPSIEVHTVDRGLNTGAAVILVAGGGHNTLNVGTEGADFVPFFYNYGVNTVILRNRLRRDGYNPQTDEVYDAQQAIRLVRAYAKEWNIDPNKIGIMGFSAGAELATAAAVLFDDFDKKNSDPGDPLAGISSRPDFVGIIYPGPSPFARNRAAPPIPRNVPPSFIACAGSDDQVHAIWADEYFAAMLALGVPNIEMHIYGNGRHPGDLLRDGSHMTGGLTDRNETPFGTWQFRFIDWFRDLGFLQKARRGNQGSQGHRLLSESARDRSQERYANRCPTGPYSLGEIGPRCPLVDIRVDLWTVRCPHSL